MGRVLRLKEVHLVDLLHGRVFVGDEGQQGDRHGAEEVRQAEIGFARAFAERDKLELRIGVCTGEVILAVCMTEPHAGTDVANYRTNADIVGDKLVLNGVKTLISRAKEATWFVVFTRVNGTPGREGMPFRYRVCREREGNTRQFYCIYHGWSYNTDGSIKGIPGDDAYPPGFDKQGKGLVPAPGESPDGPDRIRADVRGSGQCGDRRRAVARRGGPMTYCVGLKLNRGLVFMSDTRTNAGIDQALYRIDSKDLPTTSTGDYAPTLDAEGKVLFESGTIAEGEVELVVVTKFVPASDVRILAELGVNGQRFLPLLRTNQHPRASSASSKASGRSDTTSP